jgi:hypothetical protein
LHEGDDATLGVVGLVKWHPNLQVTAFMRWLDSTSHQFAYGTWMREGPIRRPWEAFYTCNLSLNHRIFDTEGGFNETFPYAACEDTELGYRLSRRGFHLDYRPSALAWNTRPITLRDFSKRMELAGQSAVILRELQPHLPSVQSDWENETAAAGFVKKVLAALRRRNLGERMRSWRYHFVVGRAYRSGMRRRQRRILPARA